MRQMKGNESMRAARVRERRWAPLERSERKRLEKRRAATLGKTRAEQEPERKKKGILHRFTLARGRGEGKRNDS
jgi:hypothetical protein